MGYQGVFGDPPFSERGGPAAGPFGDLLGLGLQTRTDYLQGMGGIDALYNLLKAGGDTEAIEKKEKEIDRKMQNYLGVPGNGKSKKESTKGKKKEDESKINITDW